MVDVDTKHTHKKNPLVKNRAEHQRCCGVADLENITYSAKRVGACRVQQYNRYLAASCPLSLSLLLSLPRKKLRYIM